MKSQIGTFLNLVFGLSLAVMLNACAGEASSDAPTSSSSSSGPSVDQGVQPIYRAFKLYTTPAGSPPVSAMGADYYFSDTENGYPSGYVNLGAELNLLANTSISRVQVWSCSITSNSILVHYASIDPNCETGTIIGPLGFLETQPISDVIIPVYRCGGYPGNLPGFSGTQYTAYPTGLITTSSSECVMANSKTIIGYTL